MKISKMEKIWLLSVFFFYFLYNFPNFPSLYDAHGLVVHALFTLIPLWVCAYVGVYLVNKKTPIRKDVE